MERHYAAYGLQLASSFALPGTPAATTSTDQLPLLGLTLLEPMELEEAWSGPAGAPEWRGRQSDGFDLMIERGKDGDLLFSYGNRARYRLDAGMTQLECAPSQSGLDWLRVLIAKVLPSISVMRGYEALHSAVVEFPDGVVAIMGPSGAGKSTLALELLRRGRRLFADDQLTLGRAGEDIRGYPGTPHMNLAESLPGGSEIDLQTLGTTLARFGGERWFAVSNTSQTPRPVAALCLLERNTGRQLDLQAVRPSPLLLAPYMLGLSIDAERQRTRFDLYADLVESAALVRLTAGSDAPERLADLIEHAVERGTGLVAGAGP
jgi:hypothetical protein